MQAPNSLHPSDRTLNDYGLGKLDDESASTVHEHLEGCQECRQRISGFTSDSFLGRFREGHKPTERSIPGGSLDGGTLSFMQAKPTSPPPSTDTLPPGLANHPDYEIKRELGRGGMGVVYLAHNTMMGRDEVLKVMGRHIMERPGVLERFQREIRAVAKLRHANIVAAYHAFRIEGGLVFSMEYVEGLDLSRLIKTKGPLSVAHAAYFVHHAALGLQHAHERGLIHRDIKPHNLMVTHDGKARLVKVLDFGLAKATREEKVDGGLTSEGQALGTPDYIAPEQIVNALDVDIRADLYSLGGTLFYLLTGRPPFQAESLYDIYQAHMSRDAEPLNLIRPEVPAELAALVAKMMAKDPKRRFQTPGEVAQALTPFFKSKAVKVLPETSQVETKQPKPLTRIVEKPAPTEPATNAAKPNLPLRTQSDPPAVEWDQLINVRKPETVLEQPNPIMPPRRPRWLWPSVSIATLLCVAFIAGWFVKPASDVRVNTPDGMIVLENVPKDAEVLVDGKKIKFTWSGDDKPIEIRVVSGKHEISVERDGFKTFGKSAIIAKEGRENVTVRLERLVVIKSEKSSTRRRYPAPQIMSGRWEFEGNEIVQPVEGGGFSRILFGEADWANYDLKFKGKLGIGPKGETNGFDVIVHHASTNDNIRLRIGAYNNTDFHYLITTNGKFDDKSFQYQKSLFMNRWYDVSVEVRGAKVRYLLDGEELLNKSDERFVRGKLGLLTSSSSARFRDLRVLSPEGTTLWEASPDAWEMRAGDAISAGERKESNPLAVSKKQGADSPQRDQQEPNRPQPKNEELEVLTPRRDASILSGYWTIEGEDLVQSEAKDRGQALLLFGDPGWSNFDFKFKGKTTGGTSGFAGIFHVGELNDRYAFGVGGYNNGGIELCFTNQGKWGRHSDLFRDGKIEVNRWYDIRIEVRGSEYRCFLAGEEIFHHTDDRYKHGRVGFSAWESTARFRDIEVTTPGGDVLWKGLPENVVRKSVGRIPPTEARDNGFLPLFNGKDLAEWSAWGPKGPLSESDARQVWSVRDNALHGSGGPSHLFSQRGDYQDFRLRAEVKINDGGNSGIYFRADKVAGFPKGYEVQINSTHRDPIKTGSLYGFANINQILVTPDTWFTLEVEAIGDRVRILINGQQQVDYTDPKKTYKQGYFAIQAHDPVAHVQIRRLEVVKLAPGLVPVPPVPGPQAFVVDGDWSVEGNDLIQRNTEPKPAIVLLGDSELEEFDLSFKAKVVGGDRFLAIFRYTGQGENWQVESGDQDGRETSIVWNHDGDDDLVEHEPVGVNRAREYAMLIQVRKAGCKVIRDKQTVLLYERKDIGMGRIGLGTWRSSARFKDIVIKTPNGKTIWQGSPQLIPKDAKVQPPGL